MLPGKVCGDVIQWEGEMWKSEERKTEMTAPITLAPLDEQTLVVLRSQDTAVRVLKRFFAGGLDAVPRRTASGRVRTVTAAWEAELIRVIELDPHEVGQDTANWTTEKLGSVTSTPVCWSRRRRCACTYMPMSTEASRPTWTLRRKAEEKADYVGNACG